MELFRNGVEADVDNELLAAQAHIWNNMLSFINSMSLKCAFQLGIPDIIHKHGHPMTLHQLTHSLPINPAKSEFVHRLKRILTHSGFFRKQKIRQNVEEEGYALTPSSKLLLKDNPSSATPLLLAVLDPILMDPWNRLSQWFQSGDVCPFVTCHGRGFWELAGCEPRLNQFFNEAMRSDAQLVSSVVIKNCKDVFLGLNSIVDVGGGTGTMGRAMADAYPNMRCTVLDLTHVVKDLKNSENLEYVGGDMFEAIPPADAVLLKWIMHDWSDEECLQILKNCKEAIPSKDKGGKVIILDMVRKASGHGGDNGDDHKVVETQLFFDMTMMVLLNGKERNEEEWSKLFFEAGFNGYKISPVFGVRSLIEIYYN